MTDKPFQIQIIHVPTYNIDAADDDDNFSSVIYFEPYLEAFTDNHKSDWSTKQVLGRMDDIATFIRTKRTINLSFIVPSANHEEGKNNYEKSKKLATFLYPVYKTIKQPEANNATADLEIEDDTLSATTQNFFNIIKLGTTLEETLNLRDEVSIMSAAPILQITFANLINGPSNQGLYGYLDAYNFEPVQESGFYLDSSRETIIPKTFKVNLTFNVIHDYKLGWTIENKTRTSL